MTLRLSAVDAPEKAQPFGQRSKQALSDLCFQQQAVVSPVNTDPYGRTVADVQCRGKDAGAEQVRTGMAWVYRQYAVASRGVPAGHHGLLRKPQARSGTTYLIFLRSILNAACERLTRGRRWHENRHSQQRFTHQ